ncbi:hypothetical protein PC121_g19190 [Phytophthora cactorum]|nr:hypothetical protein PC120_g12942 [Phytophthora cactorum]KAG3048934.1 hypothetical protein PC121_g19190 [Phytophthora cactorum]KAG4044894.1 hypothetical protein PC123_g19674 [Phytophthora cactorum]
MEAMRYGNIYKLNTVGVEFVMSCRIHRKEPWAVVHDSPKHILFQRYGQLLPMADGVPRISDDVSTDHVCAGCYVGKTRADDFPRYPKKLVTNFGVLDLVHSDVMGPIQTKIPSGFTYVVTFIDDYSRHVTVYFMKAKSDVLPIFKKFKAAMENPTGTMFKCLRSDTGGGYTGRQFKAVFNRSGIKRENTVQYTP